MIRTSRQASSAIAGRSTSLEDAIATFILGDVSGAPWDLARATGGDEHLDADEVHRHGHTAWNV